MTAKGGLCNFYFHQMRCSRWVQSLVDRFVIAWLTCLCTVGCSRDRQRKVHTNCTSDYYRLQTKLRKGNVFTSVCQEFCPQGREVCIPACMGQGELCIPLGRYPPADTPPRQPLQWTVRILLECVLVLFLIFSALHGYAHWWIPLASQLQLVIFMDEKSVEE